VSAQLDLFGPQVAQHRRRDPRPSRVAAAAGRPQREEQWKQLLRRLGAGPISADTAAQVIRKHRSVASTRLGVMRRRGLVVEAGEHVEADADGHERPVLHYELTDHGRAVLADLDAVVAAP
jgi:predicted ArsR family transcriptional regulator